MALQDEIRTDLEEEVFSEFGKTVTHITKGSPVYNERGELEDYTASSESIVAVPYNIVETRQSHEAFGNLRTGELDMALKYNQAVQEGDLFTIDSINYEVKQIDKNFLPDNVVTIVRLARVADITANN